MGRRVGHAPMITSEQTWGDYWNDHKFLFNPLAAGVFVGCSGVLCRWFLPLWPHMTLSVGAVVAALWFWSIGFLSRGQRAMYRTIIFVAAAWMLGVYTPWASDKKLGFGVAWFVGMLLSGIAYWTDQRERRRIEVERDMESWPMLAERIGIPLAHLGQKVTTDSGYKRRLWWLRGDYKLSQIRGMQEALEGALEIPAGQLRVLPVQDVDENTNPNAVDLVVNTNSAARKAPVPFTEPTMRSITDSMLIGPFEDGSPCDIIWYEQGYGGQHTLAAGMTRSGKSGLYHLMLAESADVCDMVRWGIDAKGGMALRPWAPMFDWLVCGRSGAALDEQAAMLQRLNAVMAWREEYAASKGWDVWKVSRKHPLIVLFVDEAAEVFGLSLEGFAAVQLVEKIGRMGAGVGVLLCAATQYPTVDAIASSQIQSQIGRRFCFRVERVQHQHVVLSKSATVDATFPDKPAGSRGAGWAFLQNQGVLNEMPLRVRNVNRDGIYDIVASYWTRICPMDKGSASVPTCLAEYQARKQWTLADLKQGANAADDWDDEDDTGTVTGTVAGNEMGTLPGNLAGNKTKEQDMNAVKELPTGVDVPLADLVAPRSKEQAEELDAALAAYAAENTEWSTEKATAEFWKVLRAVGKDGIRVGQLAKKCHRSTSWTNAKMTEAKLARQIQPIGEGSPYHRIVPGAVIPGEENHAT